MKIEKPNVAHVNRELEFGCAILLLAFSLALLAPGETFSRPTFSALRVIAPEGTWGMALLGIATVRLIGLWVNGNWWRSLTLRFVTSAGGAALWFWLAWLFSKDGLPGVNTGAAVYGALGCLDIFSALRSARDQGRNDRAWAQLKRAAR